MNRRCILLAAAVMLAAPLPAVAQTEYPAKPVSLIVPFSAGGRTDVVGRIVAQHLRRAKIDLLHEEFDDGHMGINYRYDRSLGYLLPRMS